MEKSSIVRSFLSFTLVVQLGACAGRQAREETSVENDSKSFKRETSGKGAPGTPAEISQANAAAAQVAIEGARRSGRGAEASAEYHFSMAQAYVAEGNSDRAIEEFKLALIFDPKSPLIYARLATEYVKKGMLTAAMETCKEALQRDPKYVDARLMLAGLYSTSRENELALKEYEILLKNNPSHEEAAVYKSQVLVEDGRGADASRSLRGFLKKNTESALAWYYLGRAEQRQGKFQDSVKAYRKALDVRPGFTQAALSLGYAYEERRMNEQAIAVYKGLYEHSQDTAAANRLATIYLKAEKYKEAVQYLESIEGADPEDMNVRVKLGLVHMELKNYDRAISIFKVILAANPDSDRIHYYLGSLYEETQRHDDAIAELRKIMPDSKLFPEAALHVAYLLKKNKKIGEARTFIVETVKRYPKHAGFYMFQANLEEDARNTPEAIVVLEKAIGLFPEDEKIRYYLGSLYDRQGEIEKSITEMETILKINPDNVDALNYIGYTWTNRGVRLNDAEKLIRRALALRPNNAYIQDSWGWYLYVRGRTNEAIVELEKAASIKPTEATILEHLGDAYVRSNLREKAMQQYKDAARYAEDDATRKKIESKLDVLHQEIAGRRAPTERVPAGQASPVAQ